jgi:hypothetical protein
VELVDRHIFGGAVNFGGRGDQDLLTAGIAGRLQYIERTFDIGIDVAVGRMITEGDRDQRRQMENNIDIFQRFADTVRVANIAGKNLDLSKFIFRKSIQPAPAIERVVVDKCFNFATCFQQRLGQVATDKTVGPGDQYSFVF